jgi:hypothetical protein
VVSFLTINNDDVLTRAGNDDLHDRSTYGISAMRLLEYLEAFGGQLPIVINQPANAELTDRDRGLVAQTSATKKFDD